MQWYRASNLINFCPKYFIIILYYKKSLLRDSPVLHTSNCHCRSNQKFLPWHTKEVNGGISWGSLFHLDHLTWKFTFRRNSKKRFGWVIDKYILCLVFFGESDSEKTWYLSLTQINATNIDLHKHRFLSLPIHIVIM